MDMNSGVNPAQSDIVRQVYQEATEEKGIRREPPPSYDATFNYVPPIPPAPVTNPPVTQQPVTNQTPSRTVILHLPLRHAPTLFNCPKCDERIVTSVTYTSTNKTHMLAGFVCGITCWCCICCLAAIPYLTKIFKEAQHTCPNCKAFLGSYSKI
ncbi:hypothetical protein PYW07_007877 [Mythimna separata]|uniref:LITAF domain-containing protein n=1 Tax=Mythimna separata TaxID=271217 RepID=A0AAD7YQ97_MYTSE|nr:hypothetical protein PYW07_007877 [Mythimna separata]